MDGCGCGAVRAGGTRYVLPEHLLPENAARWQPRPVWVWRSVSVRILSSPVVVMIDSVIFLILQILFLMVVVIGGFVWALPWLFVFDGYSG